MNYNQCRNPSSAEAREYIFNPKSGTAGRLAGWVALIAATLSMFLLAGPVAAQSCVDDVTGVNNNCTAADVTLGLIFVPLEEGEETVKCEAGQTVDVQLRASVVAGAQTRYDIGMFIAEDGGNARTGACFHDFIQPVEGKTCAGPLDLGDMDNGGTCFRDMEPGDPLDICGDVIAGEDNFYNLNGGLPVTITCTPNPNDPTEVIVSHVVSWDNTSNNTCTSVDDAVPNTKAKCSAGFSVVGNIEILVEPGISVTKTADEDVVDIGATASYTIVVTNTTPENGLTDLLDLVVTDDTCDDPPEFQSCTGGGTEAALPAGESCTYTCSVADVQFDFCNTATGTANPEDDPTEEISDIGVACVEAVGGEIVVFKETDPAGSPATFEFTVVGPGFDNTGDEEELQDGQSFSTGIIAPGEYTVTESDIPAGWTLDGIDCGDATISGFTDTSVTFDLAAEQTVTCTFSNSLLPGSITVVKNTVGGDDSFLFTSDIPGGDFSITTVAGTGQHGPIVADAGTYSIVEIVPAGWDLTSATCDNGDDPAAVSVAPEEDVTCTFVDEFLPSSITVIKNTVGGNGTFEFTSDIPGGDFSITTAGGSGQHGPIEVDPDTFSIVETVPEGWELTSATCDNGDDPAAVTVGVDENVTCTFNNTLPSDIEFIPVPTMSRLGIVALVLLLLGLAGMTLHRSRHLS